MKKKIVAVMLSALTAGSLLLTGCGGGGSSSGDSGSGSSGGLWRKEAQPYDFISESDYHRNGSSGDSTYQISAFSSFPGGKAHA